MMFIRQLSPRGSVFCNCHCVMQCKVTWHRMVNWVPSRLMASSAFDLMQARVYGISSSCSWHDALNKGMLRKGLKGEVLCVNTHSNMQLALHNMSWAGMMRHMLGCTRKGWLTFGKKQS